MFDNLLRKGIGTICNLDHTDLQWLRASLPVKDGGLGVRRVSSLASSAFLASAAATDTIQQQLVFRSSIADHGCFSVHDQGRLVVSVRHRLSHRSSSNKIVNVGQPVTALERQSVSDATDRAQLLSVTSHHSSDWLHALPLSGCGLRLDDRAIHIAVGLRLGANICEPHQCLAEFLLTQEDCMVCRAEGATVAPQDITT